MADPSDQITELLSAPLEDLITSVARGVAQAQDAIDLETFESFKRVYSSDEAVYAMFRELGYQPTWYRIPEATAEVAMSLSISEQTDKTLKAGIKIHSSPINASYSNSYAFKAEASSKLTFRIVPVPPTAQMEGLRVVPDGLVGRTYKDASALLTELEIHHEPADPNWQPQDSDKVKDVDPAPRQFLTGGQRLKLTLEREQPPTPRKKPSRRKRANPEEPKEQ